MALPAQVDIALAATEESLYIVPALTAATVRILFINRNATAVTFRAAHVPSPGGASAVINSLGFDHNLPGNEERQSPILDMNAGDEIRVQASATGVTVQAQGVERT